MNIKRLIFTVIFAVCMIIAASCDGQPASNASKPVFGEIAVGDYIKFGKYEQDNDFENGKEEIEWRVIEIKDGAALLISRYALDSLPYNVEESDVTWETCSIRDWLNGIFINEAFDEAEQTIIITSTVPADEDPVYHEEGNYYTYCGNDTTDRVFLLSKKEADKYIFSFDKKLCYPTAYAVSQGALTVDDKMYYGEYDENGEWTEKEYEKEGPSCVWWLRTPGMFQFNASFIDAYGGIWGPGEPVDSADFCVRPALWIEIDNAE